MNPKDPPAVMSAVMAIPKSEETRVGLYPPSLTLPGGGGASPKGVQPEHEKWAANPLGAGISAGVRKFTKEKIEERVAVWTPSRPTTAVASKLVATRRAEQRMPPATRPPAK
jgi:hypothetical protein